MHLTAFGRDIYVSIRVSGQLHVSLLSVVANLALQEKTLTSWGQSVWCSLPR